MDHEIDPIADEELLFRRVPASTGWYDQTTSALNAEAFGPSKKRDTTGISVSREKYKSIEEAAHGQPGKSYYIAVLRAGDLRRHGIEVVPRPETPTGHDPAHAELPGLNASNYNTDETVEWQRVLAEELCLRVEGPFFSSEE